MNSGYYYQPVYQPPETFRQWCKRDAISKRDKSIVQATGWLVLATIMYSVIISIINIIDIVRSGLISYLFSSANTDFSDAEKYFNNFESTIITVFISIFAVAMIISIVLYLLMGIYILNYSKGWAITYLVFTSIGIFSLLSLIASISVWFANMGAYQIITSIFSIAFSIAGFVLSILAVNALSRAKKQWDAQMYAAMYAPIPPAN